MDYFGTLVGGRQSSDIHSSGQNPGFALRAQSLETKLLSMDENVTVSESRALRGGPV